jgi:hypothetical protein
MTLGVILEVAAKRSFASALDWPGWSRSGRSPDDAINALVAYGPRYAAVAERAEEPFDPPGDRGDVGVVERLRGSGGTEFGVPSAAAKAEEAPFTDDADRLVRLLRAAWSTFDDAFAESEGHRLRTGPRGGGRDQARMLEHVVEAERAYLSKLGMRPPHAGDRDPLERMRLLREAFLEALGAIAAGDPVPSPNRTQKLWSPRYAIRRSAWHTLDHAWEIQDRLTSSG